MIKKTANQQILQPVNELVKSYLLVNGLRLLKEIREGRGRKEPKERNPTCDVAIISHSRSHRHLLVGCLCVVCSVFIGLFPDQRCADVLSL